MSVLIPGSVQRPRPCQASGLVRATEDLNEADENVEDVQEHVEGRGDVVVVALVIALNHCLSVIARMELVWSDRSGQLSE